MTQELLRLSEGMVNRLNQRLQEDGLRVARSEVARAEARLSGAQAAMTAFREKERAVDPARSAAVALENLGKLEGALAHGFRTDVWTLDRIAVVIQGLTGVGLSNPSVWRLLRGRLGWTVQRPARQAKERDEEAIQHWVAHEWPRIKKGQPQNRPGLSSSTNRPSR